MMDILIDKGEWLHKITRRCLFMYCKYIPFLRHAVWWETSPRKQGTPSSLLWLSPHTSKLFKGDILIFLTLASNLEITGFPAPCSGQNCPISTEYVETCVTVDTVGEIFLCLFLPVNQATTACGEWKHITLGSRGVCHPNYHRLPSSGPHSSTRHEREDGLLGVHQLTRPGFA